MLSVGRTYSETSLSWTPVSHATVLFSKHSESVYAKAHDVGDPCCARFWPVRGCECGVEAVNLVSSKAVQSADNEAARC